jgi:secretion/DNA translocation related TadE-like protein
VIARVEPARERGSGTVHVLVVMTLLSTVAGTTALVGAAISVRHRAETAADLAALSGASALQRGTPGCSAAGVVARANGAELADCTVNGVMVNVTVRLRPQGPLARLPAATAGAQAGPAAGR